MKLPVTLTAALAASLAAQFALTAAHAAPVYATSYSMPNGSTGSFNYWDDTYDGIGNTMADFAPLSGGLGDLTDGVIATDNWNVTEPPAGPGPYVGWTIDPVITFFFGVITSFASATFHFDDSNGAGGVSAPNSVTINGSNYLVAEPPGSAPFAFTVDLAGLSDDELSVQIFRRNSWVFLSEVTFESNAAAVVPVPAAGLLFISALGMLSLLRRKRRTG